MTCGTLRFATSTEAQAPALTAVVCGFACVHVATYVRRFGFRSVAPRSAPRRPHRSATHDAVVRSITAGPSFFFCPSARRPKSPEGRAPGGAALTSSPTRRDAWSILPGGSELQRLTCLARAQRAATAVALSQPPPRPVHSLALLLSLALSRLTIASRRCSTITFQPPSVHGPCLQGAQPAHPRGRKSTLLRACMQPSEFT
jgi:hypothetical protein